MALVVPLCPWETDMVVGLETLSLFLPAFLSAELLGIGHQLAAGGLWLEIPASLSSLPGELAAALIPDRE